MNTFSLINRHQLNFLKTTQIFQDLQVFKRKHFLNKLKNKLKMKFEKLLKTGLNAKV
jgi:hypothetical protein